MLLSLIQISMTLIVMLALKFIGTPAEAGETKGGGTSRPDVPGGLQILPDVVLIGLGGLFVSAPMAAVIVSGLSADLSRLLTDTLFWRAAGTSLAIGVAAAAVSVLLAAFLVRARYSAGQRHGSPALGLLAGLSGAAGSLTLLVPPVVLGAGWFLLLGGGTGQLLAPLMVIVLINALMALPFVMRVLEPAHQNTLERNGRLAVSLGVVGRHRLRQVDIPAMLPALATGFVFAVALSLGDLGAIALFGSDRIVTLPWLLYQKLGSYRTADAAGLALLLGAITMALMIVAENLGTRLGSRYR